MGTIRSAGVPDEVEFATKPRQAMALLARVFGVGVPFAWVTADEAYGQVKYLRFCVVAAGGQYICGVAGFQPTSPARHHNRSSEGGRADALRQSALSMKWLTSAACQLL
jgi:SRSO17 transposase